MRVQVVPPEGGDDLADGAGGVGGGLGEVHPGLGRGLGGLGVVGDAPDGGDAGPDVLGELAGGEVVGGVGGGVVDEEVGDGLHEAAVAVVDDVGDELAGGGLVADAGDELAAGGADDLDLYEREALVEGGRGVLLHFGEAGRVHDDAALFLGGVDEGAGGVVGGGAGSGGEEGRGGGGGEELAACGHGLLRVGRQRGWATAGLGVSRIECWWS